MGQQFTVTLSDELADMVRERVRSGEFSSVDEVIGKALHLIDDVSRHSEAEIETWLRTEVLDRCRRMDEGRSSFMTAEQVRQSIEEEHRRIVAERD